MNRLSTAWNIAGTGTFRLSSRKILSQYGTNLQNPSEGVLRLVVPDEGKIFIQADQAGAEALVVAYLCCNGNFRELFKQGIKSHIYVALHLFKEQWKAENPSWDTNVWTLSIKELKSHFQWKEISNTIKKNKIRYYIGKKTCHSANYRVGTNLFRTSVLKDSEGRVVLSSKEAKFFLDMYYHLFPEIPLYHHEVVEKVKATRVLYNLFGYPRYFFQNIKESEKKIYAWIPQSTVGTITNIAFTESQEWIEANGKEKDWDLLNDKHDSILLQVPNDPTEIEQGVQMLKQFLGKTLVGWDGSKFTMGVGISLGFNWADKSEDNPLGMEEI